MASEYDILQEMAFQNAIFYIITLHYESVLLTFIIEKCSFGRQKVIEKCGFWAPKLLREVFSIGRWGHGIVKSDKECCEIILHHKWPQTDWDEAVRRLEV